MKSIVMFSGGLDSTAALWRAAIDGATHVMALSFNYGSRHNEREARAAMAVRQRFVQQFPEIVLESHLERLSPAIFMGSGSTLMGEGDIPNEEYHDIAKESPSSTVVPYRNGVMLSIAAAIAVSLGYDNIYTGVHASDAVGWAYPDCTPEFWGSQAAAVFIGTMRAVRVVAPFIHMSKAEVVRYGSQHDAPLHITYSCYRGGEYHCGNCPTCLERIKAFELADVRDATTYATKFGE